MILVIIVRGGEDGPRDHLHHTVVVSEQLVICLE